MGKAGPWQLEDAELSCRAEQHMAECMAHSMVLWQQVTGSSLASSEAKLTQEKLHLYFLIALFFF